jgi:hypothetical protein
MHIPAIILFVFAFCVSAAVPASAQVADEVTNGGAATTVGALPSDWDERVVELRAWVKAYSSWKEWRAEYRNKPERGWLGYRSRRERPDPPTWLADECASLLEADGVLGEACDLLKEYQAGDDPTVVRKRPVIPKSEEPTKTIWWEHIHLDALWPMTQVGSDVYGVIGVHATVAVKGRFQLFVAPGAILMNLPNGPKSREWQPAADWGIAYRLADFQFPGTRQWTSLHFNFAKAWILTGQAGFSKATVELAGFSFTFKRDPKP